MTTLEKAAVNLAAVLKRESDRLARKAQTEPVWPCVIGFVDGTAEKNIRLHHAIEQLVAAVDRRNRARGKKRRDA